MSSIYIEDYLPVVKYEGLNTAKNVSITGTAAISGATAITSTSDFALAVGPSGATNPTLKIDAATASAVTGLSIKSAASGGGLALSIVSSGTNETLVINAKGSGNINIATLGTGTVLIGKATTVTGAITPTGGIAAAGGFSATPRTFHTGGVPAAAAADFNDTTPVTTETYYAEVFIPANVTLTGVGVFNGSAADGNVNVGLTDSAGAVVAQSATTNAQSGTDTYQRVPFSATYAAKGPATYYVLTQHSTTTARFNSHVVGNFSAGKVTSQTYGTFTTLTPATTFTTALGPVATLY